MLLTHCSWALDEYRVRLKNNTSQESYDNAGVDYNTFTNIRLRIHKVNDPDNYLELNITERFLYMFQCQGGLVVSFDEFGEDEFNGYDYFPDWLYETKILYVYNGTEYTSSVTTGHRPIISRVLYQQLQQADWRKELQCDCNCTDYNSTLRKWHYLQMMNVAAEICLINQWFRMMKALYKICGVDHEFADELQV